MDNIALTSLSLRELHQRGRLGEECVRLEAFCQDTKYSMILMNESLSSTSHQESLTIAEEIMKYLRTIGARGYLQPICMNLQKI